MWSPRRDTRAGPGGRIRSDPRGCGLPDPVELERVCRAAAIADHGFDTLCEVAKVGMREYELAAEVDAAMQAHGAEDNFGMIAAGAHNVAVRPPTDRRLEPGDVIISEITPCYRGYLAQLCRTLILGRPTALQEEKHGLLLRAYEQGRAAARPGRPGAEIDASLSLGEWEEIQAGLPAVRWEPADEALAGLRARKGRAEIAVLARAGAIVRAGLERAGDRLRPGLSERELTALVDRDLRYAGAEDTRFLVASGERAGLGLRPPDDRRFAQGDLVLLHVAVECG